MLFSLPPTEPVPAFTPELEDIQYIRASLKEFIEWLNAPTRGPVIFRSEVIERLSAILET